LWPSTRTPNGVTGLGWTYGPPAAVHVVKDLLAGVVSGIDADDVPAAWVAMQRRLRNAGRPGIGGLALSAADNALWDLKARSHDLPLADLLGTTRPAVPVYGSGGFTTYDADRQHAQLVRWVHDEGIPRVKIKIGASWGTDVPRDLARMTAARKSIGDADLYVDANGGYERKQAIRVMHAAADLDVRWYEEAVSSDDLAGLGQVRDAVRADVAAGEYGWDLVYFQRMAPYVDCLQVDVTRCGGITEFQRAAAVAAAHNLQVSGHCAPHQHLGVAAAIPNLRHLEWFHDHVRIERMLFDGTAGAEGGCVTVERHSPGNGRRGAAPAHRRPSTLILTAAVCAASTRQCSTARW
jgi:L-alanine-DL-glutamate epimerase-like enolase superfamily enzyme